MAPSAKKIQDALLDGTYDVFKASPEDTTVNKVRKHAEQELGLEDGFLSGPKWKAKSKTLIKERVEKLMDGWVPGEPKAKTKASSKRQSSDAASPEPKRQKRAPRAKKPARKVESDLSELSEQEEEEEEGEEAQPKKKASRVSKKQKSESSELSELSDLSEDEEAPPKKKKQAASRQSKAKEAESSELSELSEEKLSVQPEEKVKAAESDDDLSDPPDTETSEEAKPPKGNDDLDDDVEAKKEEEDAAGLAPVPDKKATSLVKSPVITLGDAVEDSDNNITAQPAVDEEEEYSDVIDELPKPKRNKKKGTTKDASSKKPAKTPKAASAKKAASASSSTPADSQEAEIKKLQSHLIKCGIRKLWHNELKQHGTDARAKVRHLRKMLADVGMEGRFSEAKAREIKENRELMAEAEAAREMNQLWGMGGGGRASRSKSKGKGSKAEPKAEPAAKAESEGSGDGGEDEDDDDEEEGNTYAARRKRVQAELAFLGDDSDSE